MSRAKPPQPGGANTVGWGCPALPQFGVPGRGFMTFSTQVRYFGNVIAVRFAAVFF